MKLFYRELGGKGQPLIILHGLFGSSDNWLTQAKMFATHFKVFLVDQRNHGQSPHSSDFTLEILADDIHEFIITNSIQDPIILGHSMGGKAAMTFAMAHPELLSKLIVVDIAPKSYPIEHAQILEGLKAITIDSIESRSDADEQLKPFVSDLGVRQFLLKNLQRKPEGGFSWKINLPVLENKIAEIGKPINNTQRFEKETLFVRGSESSYIQKSDFSLINSLFPNSKIITIQAGHWVQAEKPKEFVDKVNQFLGN